MSNSTLNVSSGFYHDCKHLLRQFEQCTAVRFQDFSNVWVDMKFSLVFRGRQSRSDMLEFCEEVLHIAKSFILPPHRFRTQMGGLYLLYGVYYKLPCKNMKIRVTLSEWKHILELHDNIREGNHTDANYILAKMMVDDVFQFCAFPKEFGLEKTYRTREFGMSNQYSVLPSIKDMTEPEQLLSKIERISQDYHRAKCSLSGADQPKRGLDMYNPGTSTELISKVIRLDRDREVLAIAAESKPLVDQNKRKSWSGKQTMKREFRKRPGPKLGDGFASDSSEEDLNINHMENYSPNLPDTFNGDSDSSD